MSQLKVGIAGYGVVGKRRKDCVDRNPHMQVVAVCDRFFDSDGSEIIRIDSVTHFYRILSVLDYVNKRGYKQKKDYQQWRLEQREISR